MRVRAFDIGPRLAYPSDEAISPNFVIPLQRHTTTCRAFVSNNVEKSCHRNSLCLLPWISSGSSDQMTAALVHRETPRTIDSSPQAARAKAGARDNNGYELRST